MTALKDKSTLDKFDIGDLCQSGLKNAPLYGIVVELDKHNYPESGLRNVGVKIKWLKNTGETREMWYAHGKNGYWLEKIKIIAKAR
tara:strand:+ start:2004 stop:2261 length:258 start_codon:yes stop_codon:yes gene_type:complete